MLKNNIFWTGAKEINVELEKKLKNDALDAKIGVDTAENELNMFTTYAMGRSISYVQARRTLFSSSRFLGNHLSVIFF